MRLIAVSVFFTLLVIICFYVEVSAFETEYITLTGEISVAGSQPLIFPVIISRDRSYTLSGAKREEFLKLSGAEVRITGLRKSSTYPRTDGDIDVKAYEILHPGFCQDLDWAVGVLGIDSKGFVIIGDNQVIYRLENPEKLLTHRMSGSRILAAGEMIDTKNYLTVMEVRSYKMLSEKADDSVKVYWHEDGMRTEILDEERAAKTTEFLIATIEEAVEERFRLYIDSGDVQEQLDKEKALEIYFPEKNNLEVNRFGAFEISRIMIFYTGRFAGDIESPLVTVITEAGDSSWQVWGCDLRGRDHFQDYHDYN